MTISLRADERAAIKEKMEKYSLNQHEVVKLAIQRFLFPGQKTDIPLNGTKVSMNRESITINGKPLLRAERKVIRKKEIVSDEEAAAKMEKELDLIPGSMKPGYAKVGYAKVGYVKPE